MTTKSTSVLELADSLLSSNPTMTSRVARKLFLAVTQEWLLSAPEQYKLLGLESEASLNDWNHTSESRISGEALVRISLLIGSYNALAALVPPGHQAHWLKTQNAAFNGEVPLDIMMTKGIEGLTLIRAYLEAQQYASP